MFLFFHFLKKITDISRQPLGAATGSSHWELFCKKGILRCPFAKEFDVFWIVQSRGTLTKLGALRSSHHRCSVRKCVLRNFAKFTVKHLCRDLFCCRPQACNFIRIETLAQVFSFEFCEISKNTFSYRTPLGDCFYAL